MSELRERLLLANVRESRAARFRGWVWLVVPFVAILAQVYIPLFFQFLSYMQLPLLVTVYFAVTRRDPVAGVFIGASIGLAEDSLSHEPLGMFGIIKTLIGYLAASVGTRFDVEHPVLRFLMVLVFYWFHQIFYHVLRETLLGQIVDFDIQQTFFVGLLNAVVALPLFHFLDKLKVAG